MPGRSGKSFLPLFLFLRDLACLVLTGASLVRISQPAPPHETHFPAAAPRAVAPRLLRAGAFEYPGGEPAADVGARGAVAARGGRPHADPPGGARGRRS